MSIELPATPYDLQYPALIGRLFGNLSMLEISLRVALYLMDTPEAERFSVGWKVASLSVGDELQDCWITSWSYLSDLVAAYNERHAKLGLEQVDAGIVDLRNALAHGCISAETPAAPYTLIKFDRPRGGVARVAEKHVMTFEWIGEQTRRTAAASRAVARRIHEIR
jgi:hypothetical protein